MTDVPVCYDSPQPSQVAQNMAQLQEYPNSKIVLAKKRVSACPAVIWNWMLSLSFDFGCEHPGLQPRPARDDIQRGFRKGLGLRSHCWVQ
jgi:hypothetical protein